MEKSLTERRGIFALETSSWDDQNLESPLTIAPLLDVLRADCAPYVSVIHRTVITPEEIDHYLKLWTRRSASSAAVLILAMHGSPARLHLPGIRLHKSSSLSLDWLEERLAGRCCGRFIHLSACRGLDVHGARLHRFLRTTEAAGVSGYMKSVPWLDSGLFEIAFLRVLMTYSFDGRGMGGLRRAVRSEMGDRIRRLGFRLHTLSKTL